MKIGEFILMTLAVAIGTLAALAIAGLYVKSQFSSASSGGSTINTILSLFSTPTTAAA
ncbi:MAG: hypothetical protein ACRED1_06375 [Limisphaerales bacterium]